MGYTAEGVSSAQSDSQLFILVNKRYAGGVLIPFISTAPRSKTSTIDRANRGARAGIWIFEIDGMSSQS